MIININKKQYNNKITFDVSGKLDIETAHELEEELIKNVSETNELVLNFRDLNYISSAGIRIVLKSQEQGKLIVKNLNEHIMDALKTTKVAEQLKLNIY
ncbi:MAG: STAS domain-containing protein [Methanobrevibacter sp.]|nr:STAS domain-containing protein [Candidatus Methanovirga basalitermitum]